MLTLSCLSDLLMKTSEKHKKVVRDFSGSCFENHFPAWIYLLTQHEYGSSIVA